MKPLAIICAGFLLSCLFFTNTSCKKNTDCVATIITLDETGAPVSNANVQLYAVVKTTSGGTVTADLKANGPTDSDGKVKFTFKLPAIYDIKATADAGKSGTGIIKLEEGKNSEKTVTLR